MPGLYGFTSNSNVSVRNTTGLYQQPGGNVSVLTSAGTLLSLLSNAGTVGFNLTNDGRKVQSEVIDGSTLNLGNLTLTNDLYAYNLVLSGNLYVPGEPDPITFGQVNTSSNVKVLASEVTISNPGVGNISTANITSFTLPSRGTWLVNYVVDGYLTTFLPTINVLYSLETGLTYANATPVTNSNVTIIDTKFSSGVPSPSDLGYTELGSTATGGAIINTTQATTYYLTGTTYSTGAKIRANNTKVVYQNLNPEFFVNNVSFASSITANTITTGNILTDNYLFANGASIFTAISGTYGNANVNAYINSNTNSTIQTLNANTQQQQAQINQTNADVTGANAAIQTLSANVGGFYTWANANFSTDSYSNTNVTAYLTTATINTTGNITGANLTTAGNVTGLFIKGSGSLLTNLPVQPGTYSNTNTAAYLTTATIATTGNVTGANLITTGNVYGAYVIGNGSLLTNLPGGAGTYSNTNVAAYLTTATISTTGNITGANLTTSGNVTGLFIKGSGSLLTNLPVQDGTYSNTNVAAYLPIYGGIVSANIINNAGRQWQFTSGGNLILPTVSGVANINAASDIVLTVQSLDWRFGTNAAIVTPGSVIIPNASGVFYANGTNILTGVGGTYSNTNVAAYLTTATIATTGNITGANLITAGNVYGSYVIGNGSLLTNLPVQDGTYSNTNVTAYLTTATIATTGNITGANLITAGNVYGAYVIGNGSLLTNLPTQAGTYSNTNTAAYLATATISTTGNITGANLITAGNVYGNYVIGDGSLLTNLPGGAGTYSNTNVAAYLATGTIAVANITSVNGYFWSNGTSYSTSTTSFNGNLAGSSLTDGIRGRVFANASPVSVADTTINGITQATALSFAPIYTNGQVNPPPIAASTVYGDTIVPSGTSQQVVGFVSQSNIALRTGAGAGSSQNLGTIGTMLNMAVTPVTANTMVNADRVRSAILSLDVNLSGKTWGTMSSTSQGGLTLNGATQQVNLLGSGSAAAVVGSTVGVGITPPINTTGTGYANVQYATGAFSFISFQGAPSTARQANVVYARGFVPGVFSQSANLTVDYAVGFHTYSGWSGSGAIGTTSNPRLGRFALLNEDVNTTIQTVGNVNINSAYLNVNAPTAGIRSNAFTQFSGNVAFEAASAATVFWANSITRQTGNILITGNASLKPYTETVYAQGSISGTVTVSQLNGTIQSLTATGNLTLNTTDITFMPPGGSVTLIITQDGTGSRLLTSNLLYAGGSKTLSTAASSIDTITVFYTGTNYLASLVKGYA